MNENIYNLISACGLGISDAIHNKSHIDTTILDILGMSTNKVRHVLNNISYNLVKSNTEREIETNYLEVGCFQGSTLCSSINNTNIKNAHVFENFSEFCSAQDRTILLENIAKFKGNSNVNLIEADFFAWNGENVKNADIYMYDGNHSAQAHYLQLSKAKNYLSNESIIVIDDWHSTIFTVKEPTFQGIRDFGYTTHFFCELPMTEFHQGLGIFVVSK